MPNQKECPYARSKCIDCLDLCEMNGKACLLETGSECETYNEYIKELKDSEPAH